MFCYVYHFSAPWWRSEVGRSLMLWSAAPAALLGLGVVKHLWPGPGILDILQQIIFVVLIVVVYRRTAIFLRIRQTPPPAGELPPAAIDVLAGHMYEAASQDTRMWEDLDPEEKDFWRRYSRNAAADVLPHLQAWAQTQQRQGGHHG